MLKAYPWHSLSQNSNLEGEVSPAEMEQEEQEEEQVDDPAMEEQLHRFWDRYPMDERATKLLLSCAPDIQAKVIETFDPRNKEEVDYSRQVTGYIRSLQTQALSRKRFREEEAGEVLVEKRLRGEFAPPTEDEIATFCGRYPIDDRALDYLSTSPSAVQHKVLAEFRPRNENEPDYSSLVTSLVKKLRMTERTETAPTLSAVSGPSGPSLDEMKDFRVHFPMDDRAWEFLLNAPGHTQEVVIKDFKPRRFDDGDYSAAVTAFVRSMTVKDRGLERVSLAKLDLFRERFPMDERAFQYLCNSSVEMQREALQNFLPRNLDETDYSRQLTYFLKRGLRSPVAGPGVFEERRSVDWRSVPDIREVIRPGAVYIRESTSRRDQIIPGRSGRGEVSKGAGGPRHSRLRAFRAQYPMDDRAFDYLIQAEPRVQEVFLEEFQPKHHADGDYSASVTSYLKVVRAKVESNGSPGAAPVKGKGRSKGDEALLENFRRRYPMDDRAFEYLCSADDSVRQKVLESFRPKHEGEADYSGLITSFIRSFRQR